MAPCLFRAASDNGVAPAQSAVFARTPSSRKSISTTFSCPAREADARGVAPCMST